jgi:hypothetical protein
MGLFDDHYRCGRLAREKNHSVESMFSQGCIFLAKDASSCRPKSLSIDLENTSPCVRCPINDHWAIDKLHRALIHRYSQGYSSHIHTYSHYIPLVKLSKQASTGIQNARPVAVSPLWICPASPLWGIPVSTGGHCALFRLATQ